MFGSTFGFLGMGNPVRPNSISENTLAQPNFGINSPDFAQYIEDGNDEEKTGCTPPSLFKFTPIAPDYTRLRLLSSSEGGLVTLRAVIRRTAMVTVIEQKDNDWWFVASCGYQGWIKVTPAMLEQGVFTTVQELRRHEDWPGNNYFFCFGKIMMGSDAKFFALTNAMLLATSALFFAYVVPYCTTPVTLGIPIGGIFVYMLYYLWMVALVEPGILPRNEFSYKPVLPSGATTTGLQGYKYCESCNIYRPPRSKHCASCQNCVQVRGSMSE